jgi:hypothetical protein
MLFLITHQQRQFEYRTQWDRNQWSSLRFPFELDSDLFFRMTMVAVRSEHT